MTEQDKAYFISWCVEEYAANKNNLATEISQIFSKHKVYKYLEENAEILHTQGKNYILKAIDEVIKNK